MGGPNLKQVVVDALGKREPVVLDTVPWIRM